MKKKIYIYIFGNTNWFRPPGIIKLYLFHNCLYFKAKRLINAKRLAFHVNGIRTLVYT